MIRPKSINIATPLAYVFPLLQQNSQNNRYRATKRLYNNYDASSVEFRRQPFKLNIATSPS